MAALVRRGQMLLAHRHPDRRWYPDCWDLIGGHVELGESPPEQAVQRECREEIAVDVLEMQRVAVDLADPNLVPYAFLVTRWRGQPRNAAKDEHDNLGWFAVSDFPSLRLAHPPTLIGCRRRSAPNATRRSRRSTREPIRPNLRSQTIDTVLRRRRWRFAWDRARQIWTSAVPFTSRLHPRPEVECARIRVTVRDSLRSTQTIRVCDKVRVGGPDRL